MQLNPAVDVFRALSELARRYQFRSRDEVCCYSLTVSQCYALQALFLEGRLTVTDVSERLGLDLSSTTRVIDQLARRKLAVRTVSTSDKRVKEVEPTDAGRKLIQRLEEDFAQMIAPVLKGFSPELQKQTPRLLRGLSQVLGKNGACGPLNGKTEVNGKA